MTLPHLDDEQLSAHLDGEGHKEAADHIGSCGECEARLAGLLLVSSLVGGSVAGAPDGVREAAVQAAGSAWRVAGRHGGAAGAAGGSVIVDLEGRRRMPRWALPVAAAAAVLLVALPVVATLSGGGDDRETAAQVQDRGSGGEADVAASAIDGGDLGDQSDPTALAQAIRGALPGAASEAALAAPAPSPSGSTSADAGEVSAVTSAPVPFSGRTSSQTKGPPFRNRPCADTVRTNYGEGLGPLVYTALVRWQGTPAVVLAYRLADTGPPGLDYRVLVMARADCRLLVGQSL